MGFGFEVCNPLANRSAMALVVFCKAQKSAPSNLCQMSHIPDA